jgi:dTDP-4-amino-4,6-dideoxygalactose transaminase
MRSGLSQAGIETGLHYPVPVHLQKAYAHLGYKPGDLPITEELCQHCLSLPIFPELSKEKICTVASVLLDLEK